MDPIENLWATRLKHLDYKAEHSYGDAKLTLQGAAAELRQCLLDLKTHFPEKGNATEERIFTIKLDCPQVSDLGQIIINKLNKIIMTQDELTEKVKTQTAQIVKIGTETRTLIDKVQALLDQIAKADVKPELQAAADEASAQLQIVDDLVPDAPTP